uniref:Uncharacterized protein n=1 Tax=Lactuca sativa TaxID=4236 RepID=A0A9R1WT38_LACSA|nr:hypothetical protein LSAT_V11C900490750 [Lactuca sativa]
MVKNRLTTTMEKEIRTNLRERFEKESAPRAYELKNQLIDKHQDGTSILSVFPTPQCTCNRCTCDIEKRLVEHQEKENLYEFLIGLDDEFLVIKT